MLREAKEQRVTDGGWIFVREFMSGLEVVVVMVVEVVVVCTRGGGGGREGTQWKGMDGVWR